MAEPSCLEQLFRFFAGVVTVVVIVAVVVV